MLDWSANFEPRADDFGKDPAMPHMLNHHPTAELGSGLVQIDRKRSTLGSWGIPPDAKPDVFPRRIAQIESKIAGRFVRYQHVTMMHASF